METILYIKNMVCDRCEMAVSQTLQNLSLHPLSVELGEVHISNTLTDEQKATLRNRLEALGFELLDDRRQQTIEQIKSAIIKLVHYTDSNRNMNLSDYLAHQLHSDYSLLSKLFSEVTGLTIERYYIMQRIERVKELIKYDQQSLTEIANLLDYSSVAYLSSQFKSVTGMTPTQFKALKKNTRKGLDKI
ncbi:AraC family transcriptional regulator [Prevotella sp. DNF00663]|uniref:helix-turn-helix domain-containing protein n=1 Tax=Prevotella sp. DNF00663 TaxID=1384078 RepID=UPI00078601EF|nr:AraC family transcriptional regulator [Prevotella sp. DNF00663]